ncbi:DUF4249 domain-containing protein [Fulvivirga sp. M361]|uniref:DUF4249 domain-containing protein n=1 Tax=Fulvivirga sp. M361 TaxID=2594266 RepID=UPI00117B3134|nr:DUF4249 domain-containing protein [Fulvivirga sp. M361]TRX60567.1 DUF4249 domain-containing protein [Fulvivirga sp. M361]
MNRIVYSLALLSIMACETPFDPDFKEKPQVVVNSFFRPGSPVQIDLSRSNFILAPEQVISVDQAIVTVSNATEVIETLLEDGQGNYTSTFIPEVQTEYFLSVQVDGFSEVTSSNIIPGAVPVQSFSIETQLTNVNLGESGYRATLTFQDPGTSQNYYGVEIVIVPEGADDIFDGEVGFLLLEDPDVGLTGNVDISIGGPSSSDGDPILFFDDIRFNGQPHTIDFFIIPINLDFSKDPDVEVYVVLKTLSKDYYQYLLTSVFQKDIEEKGTLAEPVQIANNIQNGLGIFAGYNFESLKADLME